MAGTMQAGYAAGWPDPAHFMAAAKFFEHSLILVRRPNISRVGSGVGDAADQIQTGMPGSRYGAVPSSPTRIK